MRPTALAPSRLAPLCLAALCLALSACGGDKPKPARVLDQPQEAVTRVGDVSVRANAIATAQLNPATAKAYGIDIADDTVLLVVAVRQGPDGQDRAVPAEVAATATTLQGQRAPIALREVRTGDLVDHVGIARVVRPDTLTFDIAVKRDGRSLTDLKLVRDFAKE